MLKRIRARVSPGTVIGTIALFAALGGGYATAFSGSGTVQKGALLDIPNGAVTVRSLTGIGLIQASCDGVNSLSVAFENTSGEDLRTNGIGIDDAVLHNVGNGDADNLDSDVDGFNTMYVHVSPVDGTKRPQADVQITAVDSGDCTDSSVAVLATNTEE